MGCPSSCNVKIIFLGNSSYDVVCSLGKGGFGKVFKIKDDNNRYFAVKEINIKQLSEEEKNKRRKEISILENISKFNNEYIVKLYDSFEDEKNGYLRIKMEFGGDSNLKKFIEKYKNVNKYMDEQDISNIIMQICYGLKEIHASEIIHRDLSPDNIFIDDKNNIKIGDFGISIEFNENETNNDITKDELAGKTKYMAPEISQGKKYNFKVDTYSLGCIIYELFTLKEYYISKNFDDIKSINLDVEFNEKWKKLIKFLVEDKFEERFSIDEVIEYIKKENLYNKNEIRLRLIINDEDIKKKIYFISEKFELKNLNVEIYINGQKQNGKPNIFFEPDNKGIYNI